MKRLTRIRFGLTALFMILALGIGVSKASAAETGKSFKDVPSKHWSYSYVQNMINKGIISGYVDGTFHPREMLTREQFARLLTLTLDLDLVAVPQPTFSDVKLKVWSYPYIETVKDYLEGYSLPVGKPFFDPSAVVSREDVAVALVKAMKIKTDSASAEQVIRNKVSDYNAISPGLAEYVAAAIENNLISGFEDGTFKPRKGLDRSSAAALLSKVIESPLLPPLKEIELTVQAPDSVETEQIHVEGTISREAKLYLDGKELAQTNGSFTQDIDFTVGEGDYDLEFKAIQPNGRYKSVLKRVNFTIPDPQLTADVPATTEKKTISVSGKVADLNDSNPTVTVNGNKVFLLYSGEWTKDVAVHEGNNAIIVIAKNKYDKVSSINKNVLFTVKPPELTLEQIPATQNTKSLKITGKVSDLNDTNPRVYLNDALISENGIFDKTITLTEGENKLVIEAVNSLGKKTTISKTVNYVILPPEITVESLTATSLDKTITLKVSAADLNDPSPKLYLNDRYMAVKNFSTTVTLNEGENTITIKAMNTFGKQSTLIKKVTYLIQPPEITLDPIPETTSVKTLTINASATDYNDSYPVIYLNGLYQGSRSFTNTVTLKEGENTITVKATNNLGKSKEIVKKIIFTSPAPLLTVNTLPETTTTSSLTITASASDNYDFLPKLYLNGQYIDYLSFSRTVTLVEGENVFEIKATNNAGKSSQVIKKVTLVIPGPTLTVGSVPASTNTAQLTLTASATDPNENSPKLYLNGEYINNGSFSKTVTLVEGENNFEFKATNTVGKTSEVIVKKVTYTISGPTLTVSDVAATTSTAQITLTARATDPTDANPKIYLNGQLMSTQSFTTTVTLTEGENVFEIKATNSSGKTSEIITKKITYTIPGPASSVRSISDMTNTAKITASLN